MEPDNSPRKIQFTVPLLEPHLDPEAAEQIRRRRPTPATLVLTSDQSSPEIDEDRIPNPLLKSTLAMSPRQRKKVTRTTPTMKELQMMVEHHLGQQQQEEEPEGAAESTGTQETCPSGITDTEAESRLGASEKAQKPAESTPKTQKRDSKKPSTEEPSTHIPPLDSQGANSV
ncbi:protein phosphatase 1 regulatory inhibitor subunit 1A [Phyllostomus discolor]|uniref:Protein phosphatase 1 regulatory subunit 1A n=3 Tax=Phyllostomus discolor TaxID=89673 RepID=A0A6J2ND78_9CHIR|nr:protein phosphatase 1 regulatory subunit 1A [Phyllostomus discolor]XP_045685497.1 protein phosphatase 1 regulatory subunit 1A [Phyllostomus hastatus]KAF6121204.1 protein phosphatase 1 regulatory inhibitor subunit 1A [Phyllostomus discolor]